MTSIYFDTEAVEAFEKFVEECKSSHKTVVVLCDTNTEKYCFSLLERFVSSFADFIIAIPFGEEHKNIETVNAVWQRLLENNIDKNTVLMSIGGGVVCDLGGFVAATYKRGIESVYIPTSLIAQTDASIGGKTAFNFHYAKNQIGLFNYPKYIFIIPELLKTLPEKEIWSGFMEMLKHGLIADKNYWNKLIQVEDISQILNQKLIQQSIDIKTAICRADPHEKGERKKLNFGHTIGHAMEALSLETNQPLSHGDAIGIGMIAESFISLKKNLLREQEFFAISNAIYPFLQTSIPQKIYDDSFFHYLNMDKKKIGASIHFTLLNSIGNAVINQNVSDSEIISALDYLRVY